MCIVTQNVKNRSCAPLSGLLVKLKSSTRLSNFGRSVLFLTGVLSSAIKPAGSNSEGNLKGIR